MRRACEAQLDVVALTDHNSCLNSRVFADLCADAHIRCLHGMEACTSEEIHCLCLFARLDDALRWAEFVREHLPSVPLIPEAMGDQIIVDREDRILGFEMSYLGVATRLTLTEMLEEVRSRGGLFIPSHMDRTCFSLLSQLGRVPDLPYSALEISPYYDLSKDPAAVCGKYPLIGNSDAHTPARVGRRFTEYAGSGPCVDHFDPRSISDR